MLHNLGANTAKALSPPSLVFRPFKQTEPLSLQTLKTQGAYRPEGAQINMAGLVHLGSYKQK